MGGTGLVFEHVLDARIAAHRSMPPAPPALDPRPDPGLRVAMAGTPWLSMRVAASGRAYGATASAAGTPRHRHATATTTGLGRPPAARRPRPLSAAGHQALARLRQWGAELADDFTPDELKHEYRRLAMRYHPDQHPRASAATRAALGGTFHQVHDTYRTLTAALA